MLLGFLMQRPPVVTTPLEDLHLHFSHFSKEPSETPRTHSSRVGEPGSKPRWLSSGAQRSSAEGVGGQEGPRREPARFRVSSGWVSTEARLRVSAAQLGFWFLELSRALTQMTPLTCLWGYKLWAKSPSHTSALCQHPLVCVCPCIDLKFLQTQEKGTSMPVL